MSLDIILKRAEAINQFLKILDDAPTEIKQTIIMMEFYPHLMTGSIGSSNNTIVH